MSERRAASDPVPWTDADEAEMELRNAMETIGRLSEDPKTAQARAILEQVRRLSATLDRLGAKKKERMTR